jgi:hypothetical protein
MLKPSTGAIVMEIVDGYGAPRHTIVEKVSQIVDHRPQSRLMEKNGGSAQEGLKGLPGPFVPIL